MTQSSIAIDAGALRTLSVAGGYADYEHNERDDSGMALSTFKDNEWDARVEALFGTVGPLTESALGIQLQNRNFSALGGGAEFLLPTATRTSAAFLFTEAALASQLRLQAGARVERVRVDGTPASDVPTSRVFTPLSASLGIERANSVEATLRIRAGRARFEAALWTARFDGYIYGALTGRLCDEDGDCDLAATASSDHVLQELNFEHRDAKFSGAEAKATLVLSDSAAGVWNAELVADVVRATLDGAGNVPRLPPYRAAAALNWTTDAFDAGVRVRYSGRQDRTAFAETPTAGFTSVDAQLGWRPPFGGDTLQLMLIGRNLTDSTQRNSVAFNKDEVILPGRDLRLVVRARF